jgi:hypothetical protein
MLDCLWSGVSKSAPQVPQAPAETARPRAVLEDKNHSAEGLEKTAPPPQSNPDPVFAQPQVSDTLLATRPSCAGATEADLSIGVEQTLASATPDEAPAGDATQPSSAPGCLNDADAGLRRYQRAAGGRRLVKKDSSKTPPLTPPQRLLLLDTWRRSGLPNLLP